MHRSLVSLVLLLAPCPALAQMRPEFLPQGITVQGSATIETPPDIATISITLHGEGQTPDAASTALAAVQKAVIGGIAAIDPAIDYRTGAIAMREIRKGDCAAISAEMAVDRFVGSIGNDGGKDDGPCRVVGHAASIEATVEMRAIDEAGTAIGLARRLGASSAELGSFDLRDPAAAQRAAAAAAIADARARAEALAAASGAKLGPVVSILGGNDNAVAMALQQPTPLYAVAAAVEAPVTIDISPKPVETRAQIVLVYALVR